jgi:nucleoside-diphosphate-sugar epimerase
MAELIVTGAAGFLGAALLDALAREGRSVHAVVHPRTDLFRLEGTPAEVHRVDLADFDAVSELVRRVRPETVFHSAAAGGHGETAADRLAGWRDTVLATGVLLEAMTAAGCSQLVHVGSSLEYGPSAGPKRESDVLRPAGIRGVMKAATAMAVEQWGGAQPGRRFTILRPFAVYGPGEQPHRLVPTVMRCLRTGDALPTVGGVVRRDFVYVDDVVSACLLAAAHPAASGRAYNVGTGIETSVAELVDLAQAVTGRTLKVDPGAFPSRPVDAEHWVADISRARDELGWTPRTALADGLARTFAAGLVAAGERVAG